MSRFCVSTEPVSRRSWRSGHPFRPRCGRMRRIGMVVLLLFFGLIIFGYNYVTNADRVRDMAETYLSSRMNGGKVKVRKATLSIFEGLTLEDVKVYVDDGSQPDSLLFSAQSFAIKYDLSKIICNQLEANQIVAQKPHVYLTENVATHEWNFYRLGKGRPAPPPVKPTGKPVRPVPLPEVLLRNARVEISEVRDGRLHEIGYEAMDGHLTPSSEAGSFSFDLQTRGPLGVGPWASGKVSLGSGVVDAELHDFDLGRDLHSMLWENVRLFFEHHVATMSIDSLTVHYEPPRGDEKFKAKMVLKVKDTSFTVKSEDWLSAADLHRREVLADGVDAMRQFYRMGGYRPNVAPAAEARPDAGSPAQGDKTAMRKGDTVRSVDAVTAAAMLRATRPLEASPATLPPRPLVLVAMPLASPADALAAMIVSLPIQLRGGAGTFIFTESGVELKDVRGEVEGNTLVINGSMTGYTPDSPFSVHVRTVDHDTLDIVATPRYLNALPSDVRELYTALRPNGRCTVSLNVNRATSGGRPMIDGHVEIVDGIFDSIFFPYPLSEAHGVVMFGYDPKKKGDIIRIMHVSGRGIPGGPNRDTWVTVDGEVGPVGIEFPDPEIVLHVNAVGALLALQKFEQAVPVDWLRPWKTGVSSETELLAALPPPAREPLKLFDADHTCQFPTFHGDVSSNIVHRANAAGKWTFDTDLALDDASGKLVGFPYPIEHMAVDVHVRDGYVQIDNAHMKRGQTDLRVDGRVTWQETPPGMPTQDPKVTTDIRLSVHDLPLDDQLLAALPADQAVWIKRIGVSGNLDVDGRVFQGLPDPARPGAAIDPSDVRFDLGISLRDGTLWPADGMFSVSNLSARLHLSRDAMEISEMHGRRGAAELSGQGALAWSDGPFRMALRVNAKNLAMDSSLHSLLPAGARESWDNIRPEGTLDAEMTFRHCFTEEEKGQTSKVSPQAAGSGAIAGLSKPALCAFPTAFSTMPEGFYAVLRPKEMSCTLKMISYRLDKVRGIITIAPEKVTLQDVTAVHGAATIAANGVGMIGDRSTWDLRLSGHDLPVDDELRRALPPAMVTMLDSVKLRGKVDFDIPKLAFRGDGIGAAAASAPSATGAPAATATSPATSPASSIDMDLASTIDFKDCSFDAGVPVQGMFGKLDMAVVARGGKISALQGSMAIPKVTIAGREMTDMNLEIRKPRDVNELYLEKMHGTLAGGRADGKVQISYPDIGPSRYLLSVVVRNADLETLVQDSEKDLKGELMASLQLEGTMDASAIRRGRGDVLVNGKELYHLPLVLGLFQVTSLSLPIATPFKTGSARYSVEGQRISFERVELKSDNMLMQGNGYLDFKTKQVRMTFTTDNPSGLKVPFVTDLLAVARGELLKITIKGTIKEPKVSANPFGTVTTTIDEVLKGDAKK